MSDGQKPKWEKVTEHVSHHGGFEMHIPLSTYTQRLKVPGGWLYLVWQDPNSVMCFVPDPSAGQGEGK